MINPVVSLEFASGFVSGFASGFAVGAYEGGSAYVSQSAKQQRTELKSFKERIKVTCASGGNSPVESLKVLMVVGIASAALYAFEQFWDLANITKPYTSLWPLIGAGAGYASGRFMGWTLIVFTLESMWALKELVLAVAGLAHNAFQRLAYL